MSKTVAQLLVDTLAVAGVKRVYGVAGDSLNGITDAIRRRGDMQWVHVRHEETAAFAAGAEAHLTRTLAVCAGSCGPGNTDLINGLYDAHRSRVPVLAIAAQIPSREIGSGYFQETHPEIVFRECSHYCELVSHPEQMARVLDIAIHTAISRQGVSVIVIPGDIALQDADGDGGLAMLLGDLLSLQQFEAPVKLVVFQNDALAFVELEMKAAGLVDFATELKNPNFAKLAEAAGVLGLRAESPEQVEPMLTEALQHNGPALVDVLVNRQELSLPPKINLEQVGGFALYMARAVLSGRCDEIVELARTNIFR